MPSPTNPAKVETPFTTAALGNGVDFWKAYVENRPHPSDSFFELISEYHHSHGDSAAQSAIAHDVGTGPGNIAEKLLRHFDHVVGSDVNEQALAAAPALLPADSIKRMTFVKSSAEDLASANIPESVGKGQTDLILVSECIPLLDISKAFAAFRALLRPGGTLAIYFYSRPIFTGDNEAELNQLYDRIATRVCQFLLPFKGTPGFPIHYRAAEAMSSGLDSIPFDPEAWQDVVRYKWNADVPLTFNSKEGYDFEVEPVDRRDHSTEITKEITDRDFWAEEWDIGRVASFLDSVFPNYRNKAGDKFEEVQSLFTELETALGGPKATRKVSFPVVLLLATRK
ncbi:hypothetical protein PFICI_10834 [Pestalotiopsis fici W106-1]|uniref:Methyltransferase ptaI n=1 Tax=Pestalotiopsis fici (strain W106-1 / CGMCC3.15140) TaxID=1229662 RepID=PTAI_PESFW|nr:uncharacterized protein PFICI_10834 [Pestalotiopsis fici W106-1]A0A067XMT3.1 RecName: Full=Methyltransferase ptaI; AltName: Full=Pestheic acid biosynthesis cluster protein I [Pestalotiopsis fici W106-1]AGO59038.1 PtaI [Pestalotiopsis fici]ETS76960.1 hypothetical protein PFICI_10834 [Pestalotiopsis fici W106-1]